MCTSVTTPEIVKSLGIANPVTVKAIQLSASNGWEMHYGSWDGAPVRNTQVKSQSAYTEAGIDDPRADVSATMEYLSLSESRRAPFDLLDCPFDRGGALPCQVDGGLKCFGHPVDASGLRMAYGVHTQLLRRAGERQLVRIDFGLAHYLGETPYNSVAAVSILGRLS